MESPAAVQWLAPVAFCRTFGYYSTMVGKTIRLAQGGLGLCAAAALACSPKLSVPAESVISCTGKADCPKSLKCGRHLLCIPSEADDSEAVASSLLLSPLPGRYGVGAKVTFRFEVSRTLGAPATAMVGGPKSNRPADLQGYDAESNSYTFTYVVDENDENGSVDIRAVLPVAPPAVDTTDFRNAFQVDIRAPDLLSSRVVIIPDDNNLRRFEPVNAASPGAKVRVLLVASENLSSWQISAVPVAGSPAEATAIDFVEGAECAGSNLCVAVAEVPRGGPAVEATYRLVVELIDVLGNITRQGDDDNPFAESAELEVFFDYDTAPPAELSTEATRLTRIPWGNHDHRTPFLSLEYKDVGEHFVAVFDRAQGGNTAVVLGRSSTPEQGSIKLQSGDRVMVYAALMDRAGNVGPRHRVRAGRWRASLRGRVAGDDFSNPHRVTITQSTQSFAYSLLQIEPTSKVGFLDAADASAPDGPRTLLVQGVPSWRERTLGEALPPMAAAAMAVNTGTAETYLFAGEVSGAVSNTLWRFDGSWHPVDVSNQRKPSARFGAAMTYDSRRDRLVVFSGTDRSLSMPDVLTASGIGEIWEFDGRVWTAIPTSGGPAATAFSELVYDQARGISVLFGGARSNTATPDPDLVYHNETWGWDGTAWTALCTGACTPPPARAFHAMTYNSAAESIFMFGGLENPVGTKLGKPTKTMWRWDGTTWSKVEVTGKLSAQYGHQLTYTTSRLFVRGGRPRMAVVSGCLDNAPTLDSLLGCRKFSPVWLIEQASKNADRQDAVAQDSSDTCTKSRYSIGGPTCLAHSAAVYEPQTRQILRAGGNYSPSSGDCDPGDFDGGETCTRRRSYSYRPLVGKTTRWTLIPAPGSVPQTQVGHGVAASRRETFIVGGSRGDGGDCDAGAADGVCDAVWRFAGDWSRFPLANLDNSPWRNASLVRHVSGYVENTTGFRSLISVACTDSSCQTWQYRLSPDPPDDPPDPPAWEFVKPPSRLTAAAHEPAFASAWDGTSSTFYTFGGAAAQGCALNANLTRMSLDKAGKILFDVGAAAACVGKVEGPCPRMGGRMVFDEARKHLVLFGGYGAVREVNTECVPDVGSALDDMWVLDTSRDPLPDWKKVPLDSDKKPPPPARARHAMVYLDDGRLMLFGGAANGATVPSIVWEWRGDYNRGGSWASYGAALTQPAGHADHALVYDRSAATVSTVGGGRAEQSWIWDASGDSRPGMIFEFDWRASGLPGLATPTSLRLIVSAEGKGFNSTNEKILGINVEAWDTSRPGWRRLLKSNSEPGPDSPPPPGTVYDFTTSTDFIYGDGFILVRVSPNGTTRTAALTSAVTVDYVELVVEYELPRPNL